MLTLESGYPSLGGLRRPKSPGRSCRWETGHLCARDAGTTKFIAVVEFMEGLQSSPHYAGCGFFGSTAIVRENS